MQISFSTAAVPKNGVIVIPVFEKEKESISLSGLAGEVCSSLEQMARSAGFEGTFCKTLDLVAPPDVPNGRVILVGAGPASALTPLRTEAIGGTATAKVLAMREKTAIFLLGGFQCDEIAHGELAARVAFGARMRTYRFDRYRTTQKEKEKPVLAKMVIHGVSGAKSFYGPHEKTGDGVFLARDLVSEPANVLFPKEFAARCRELESTGLNVKVLTETQMKKLGMGSLLGVGQGSAHESRLVAMEWKNGRKGDPVVALVGKGVTFDTGGISLKPSRGMEDMKWDMGGAAAVTGAMAALAGRKARANVVGVIGLVENMPDGNAQRPGDVVTSMSGQTIEVLNTDAEGRLVLADALWWTQKTYSPETVIDLATLTGAIIVSLAHEFAGMFSKDDALVEKLHAAGEATGDRLWRMPLTAKHDEMIRSGIADMKNIGDPGAGSSTAAAFLGRFIMENVAWAHLDIAGMAWNKKATATIPKGGSGYGVRLLDSFIRENYES